MRVNKLVTTFAAIAVVGGTIPQIAQAAKLRDGTISFVQPPRLVAATTSYKDVNVWNATYYFTISLPEQAGEPLQKVTIDQSEGVDRIRFDLEDTRAFEGTRQNRGEKIPLGVVTRDKETKTITVVFDPPVTPGKIITIGLRPVQNPRTSGVYLFGLRGFPPGEKTASQFLGYGRLQFYGDLFD